MSLEQRVAALEARQVAGESQLLLVRWCSPEGDDDADIVGVEVGGFGGDFIERLPGESIDALSARIPRGSGPFTAAFLVNRQQRRD